jgi:peptide/nickel transport system substrate-binding protein
MVDRTTKLRWRRRLRRRRQQVENIGEQAEAQLEEHIIDRLGRLWNVRRFIFSWLVLVVVLMGTLIYQNRALGQFYQTEVPTDGGTYTEGIVGAFTTANPLYSNGPVDSAVARLVFSGLFTFNDHNNLVGDLAQEWSVNERGNIYTVTLKPNLVWQDGRPLTAADVVFTYGLIQNPDTQSPLASSWQGVTVAAQNPRVVTFTLPQALGSFPYAMTNGIVPQHILAGTPPAQIRSIAFDTKNPVGAGPFKWQKIEVVGDNPESREERVAFTPNPNYAGGKPKLDQFVIRAFHAQNSMVESFRRHELNGAAGLGTIPDNTVSDSLARAYSFQLTSESMIFLKTSSGVLANLEVRKALAMATNRPAIVGSLGYPARVLYGPLLPSQTGFVSSLTGPPYDVAGAKKLLDENGWKVGKDGVRSKDGQKLTFQLISENTPEYSNVASQLSKQWAAIGVKPRFDLQKAGDLQTALVFHNYDALLYGISLGVDPDVFAYWDSSQADIRSANRLNLSEYKSSVADRSLEAGRTRTDSALRTIKYRPFLDAWNNDVPGIALYQPRFLYLTKQTVAGLTEHTINGPIDRYNNVQNWMIRQTTVNKP